MAITISDKTVNPVIVVSGGTITPFSAVTINDSNVGLTSDVVVAWAEKGMNAVDFGTFTDPAGGGTATIGKTVGNFDEKATNTGVPTAGTSILQRLQFKAPTLLPGQFRQIIDAFAVITGKETATESPPTTPLIDVVTPPAVAGTVANQPVGASATINPFATVTITDTDFGAAKDVATIVVNDAGKATDDLGGLTGAGLSKTGIGTYTLPNPVSPAQLQTELRGLTLSSPGTFGDHTVSIALAVTDVPVTPSTPPPGVDLTKALTTLDNTTSVLIKGQPQPPAGNNFHILDTTNGTITDTPGVKFTGPVPGIANQLIVQDQFPAITKDNLNITAVTPNVFIHSGTGMDAIDVSSVNGTNVLDGFTGSNFLVGGTGKDTFFLDNRSPPGDIFSTIRNFHSGDVATVWGVTKADFKITPGDNVLPSAPGLDFAITAPGKPNANVVLPGYTTDDLKNGKLVLAFGKTPDTPGLPGSDFWIIQAT